MKKNIKAFIFLFVISLSLPFFFSCNIGSIDFINGNSETKKEETVDKDKNEEANKEDTSNKEDVNKDDTNKEDTSNKDDVNKDDTSNKEEVTDPTTPSIPSAPDSGDKQEGDKVPPTEGEGTTPPTEGESGDSSSGGSSSGGSSSEGDKVPPTGGEETTPPSGGESGDSSSGGSSIEGDGNGQGESGGEVPQNPDGGTTEGDVNNPPPLPGAITNDSILKLKAHPTTLDENYMYIMVRFTGLGGGWKMDENVYPRGFVLGFYDMNEGRTKDHFVNGFDGKEPYEPIPGRGYTKETGFCPDNTGVYFFTNFYCGFEGMRTRINGTNDITFKFDNFVIWDPLDDGIGFGNSHPSFARFPQQNGLKINIPMKEYDKSIHKNIAYVTIYFERSADGNATYKAVLDGFEPKN